MSIVKKTVLSWVGDRLMTKASVTGVTSLSPRFRLIELRGDFKSWTPGDKLQINVGDWNVRTYTPITCTGERLSFLGFISGAVAEVSVGRSAGGGGGAAGGGAGAGAGARPGSDWLARVRVGDPCQFVGPRASLNLANQPTPTIFFGDETTFGAAAALRAVSAGVIVFVFEVADVSESSSVLNQIGLSTAVLVVRGPGCETEVAAALASANARANSASFLLSGQAASISSARSALKSLGVSMSSVKSKPYWVFGKEGLD